MIERTTIDGRGALVADMPDGYTKVVFDDGEIAILAPIKVEKFNPFHDTIGRFTTEGGANYISTGPKFERTIARLRSQMKAKEAETAEIEYDDYSKDFESGDDLAVEYGVLFSGTQAQWNTLTENEKLAIRVYSSSHASNINYKLGQGYYFSDTQNSYTDKLNDKEVMDGINSGVAKMTIPKNMMLYSALSLNNYMDTGGEIINRASDVNTLKALVGKTLTAKAVTSTSASLWTARAFQHSGRIIVQIEAQKGQTGAWIGNDYRRYSDEERSLHPGEGEVVLPVGQKFVVTGAKYYTPKGGDGDDEATLLTVRLI